MIFGNLLALHLSQLNLQQQSMQNCNFFIRDNVHNVSALLQSRISQDLYQKSYQKQYIIHKIAKADKKSLENYQTRAKILHPNVVHIYLQQQSRFYHTIYIEKCSQFSVKDLLMLPNSKRIMVLVQVLFAVKVLSQTYGFFYITEKMLGYRPNGQIALWINQNVTQNKRSFPINHQKLSEDVFVSDFKDGFAGHLRQLRQFKRVKKIDNLIQVLQKGTGIAQSHYMSEPSQRDRRTLHIDSQIGQSEIDCRQSIHFNEGLSKEYNFNNRFNEGLKKTASLSILKKPTSISYLPNQMQRSVIKQSKILPQRALSSSVSMHNLLFKSVEHGRQLNRSNSSLNFGNLLKESQGSNHLSKSIVPKINFSYQNSHQSLSWKKKADIFSNPNVKQSQNLIRSSSHGSFGFPQNHDHSKQILKSSFPHTTSNTFIPLASNGNISLGFKESANLQRKGIGFIKQDDEKQEENQKHISEDSNEVQMDLDILFSDDQQIHSKEQAQQLEMIMEEFENVLLS